MILEYRGVRPRIGNNVFIAPTAVVIGDVEIRDNASIWYGTVVRGDRDTITIGENTNIQDNCTVHTDPGKPVFIGSGVSVGHGAVVHGCTIENDCLIGIKAAVLNGAVIRQGSIVGSGAVVREGQEVGPFQLVAGVRPSPKSAWTRQWSRRSGTPPGLRAAARNNYTSCLFLGPSTALHPPTYIPICAGGCAL